MKQALEFETWRENIGLNDVGYAGKTHEDTSNLIENVNIHDQTSRAQINLFRTILRKKFQSLYAISKEIVIYIYARIWSASNRFLRPWIHNLRENRHSKILFYSKYSLRVMELLWDMRYDDTQTDFHNMDERSKSADDWYYHCCVA